MATIRHQFHINTDPQTVFEHFSQIDLIKQWWTEETSGGEEVGDTIEFRFGDRGFIKVMVTELDQYDKISWKCLDGDPQWHGTEMTFSFEQNDEGLTRIDFIHSGWAEATEFFGVCSFSWAKYFISMKSLIEQGVGEPYYNQI